MLEGLDDDELETYLEDTPRIVPLFKINVIETIGTYATPKTTAKQDYESSREALMELRWAQDAFEQEMEIS